MKRDYYFGFFTAAVWFWQVLFLSCDFYVLSCQYKFIEENSWNHFIFIICIDYVYLLVRRWVVSFFRCSRNVEWKFWYLVLVLVSFRVILCFSFYWPFVLQIFKNSYWLWMSKWLWIRCCNFECIIGTFIRSH